MKKVVVTGAAGRLGRVLIQDLLERNYEVLGVDIVEATDLPCLFLPVDLTEAAAVYDVLSKADAVIHLGAIPGTQVRPASTTFHNNVQSTYNVVEAAAAFNLQKIVFASSVFTLGWAKEADRYWPQYVPVDETHPLTPFESYGLSKVIGEDICAAVSRRTGIPSVSLRIMNVIQPEKYDSLPWKTPTVETAVRFVFWPYVGVDDAARACRLALEAETRGHEAFFIAARDIRFNVSTRELLAKFATQVEIRGKLDGTDGVISIEKARTQLGFEPEYSWRTGGSEI